MKLIANGTVVSHGRTLRADLLIEGERIVALGTHLGVPEEVERLDATGCYVLPGVIDCHLHFDLETMAMRTRDTFFHGSRTAAAGGVTCYIDYISQRPGESFAQAIADRRAEADGQTLVDYSLHLNVTDLRHGQLAELPHLVPEHGIASIKTYTTYKPGGFYADDWTWFTLLRLSREHGYLVETHCENDDLVAGAIAELRAAGKTALRYQALSRPPFAETEAVHRGLFLARRASASSYYVHQSVAESVDAIVAARRAGQPAIAETCPHFLMLTEAVYDGAHPEWYIMNPPLRDEATRERLWAHVAAGHITCIGSDHCGYPLDQRLALNDCTGVAPGIPGTELILPLLYSEGVVKGRITLPHLVDMISTNPACVFGLAPDKGELRPGSEADIAIFDPSVRWTATPDTLFSQAGYTPYFGMELAGRVRTTLSRGTVVFDEGRFPASNEHGRFVKRRPHDPETSVP